MPTILTIHPKITNTGIECCCCRCCTCLNLSVLKSDIGIVKLLEIGLGLFCQSLMLGFGMDYASTLGASYLSYITNLTWCLMTSSLLLFCYIFSERSINFLKKSLFETAFNGLAAFTFLSSSSYLAYMVRVVLQPLYVMTPYFQVYPALSAAYMIGSILGLVYVYDAYKSYKFYTGTR